MDPSKLLSSWCVGNIWGLYSMMVILFGAIASINSFPTGTVKTQTSLPEGTSISDRSSRSNTLTQIYVSDLDKKLGVLCEDFVTDRFNSVEPPTSFLRYSFSPLLDSLPDISNLLPNKIVLSEDLPTRAWIHYQILHLFNRTMDNIIFDESQNNASNNFGDEFRGLQKSIERVLAGILETIHERGWLLEEDDSITISQNLDDFFERKKTDTSRNFRDYIVLSFFNDYLSTLISDVAIL